MIMPIDPVLYYEHQTSLAMAAILPDLHQTALQFYTSLYNSDEASDQVSV